MNLETAFEKLREEREYKQESTGTIVGQCFTFCPEYESLDRQIRRDINKFELILIKKYQRSAAGKTKAFEEDIRPIGVLRDVSNYLFSLLNPANAYEVFKNCSFRKSFIELYNKLDFLYDLYKFIEDRLRAVRLDISAQSLSCRDTIILLEKISRFYILFNHLLYDYSDFDLYLHFDQLSRTLADLMEIYKKTNSTNPEFEHYFTLTNIKDPELFDDKSIFNKKSLSSTMLIACHQKHYSMIFATFKRFDYLSKCIFLPHLLQISEKCIMTLRNTVSDVVSVDFVLNFIPINSEELHLLIDKCGIEMNENMLDFKNKKNDVKEYQILRSKNFYVDEFKINNVEMLIYNGQVDLQIKDLVIRQFTDGVLNKLLLDKLQKRVKSNSEMHLLSRVKKRQPFTKPTLQKEQTMTHTKKPIQQPVVSTNKKAKHSNKVNKLYKTLRKMVLQEYLRRLILKNMNQTSLYRHVPDHLFKWQSLTNSTIRVLIVNNDKTHLDIKQLIRDNIKTEIVNIPEYNNIDQSIFNFFIFVLEDKKLQKRMIERNTMYNIFVGNESEFNLKLKDKFFLCEINVSKRIMHQRLFELVKNKNRDEVGNILFTLRANKRNNSMIDKNLSLHLSHRKLIDCDVYYEKGSILGTK